MILTKENIEKRLRELDAAIMQQGQYVQQMNNQILMLHGAKEEYNVLLKQLIEAEKLEPTKADESIVDPSVKVKKGRKSKKV
jgi:hypothetical protein